MAEYYVACTHKDHPDGPAQIFGPLPTLELAESEMKLCSAGRHILGWGPLPDNVAEQVRKPNKFDEIIVYYTSWPNELPTNAKLMWISSWKPWLLEKAELNA